MDNRVLPPVAGGFTKGTMGEDRLTGPLQITVRKLISSGKNGRSRALTR